MAFLNTGLDGVIVAQTRISQVNGKIGQLIYYGHNIEDIVAQCNFESASYLVLHGELPTDEALQKFTSALVQERHLPERIHQIIATLPRDIDPMAGLRTAVSALSISQDYPPSMDDAMKIIAKVPLIVAAVHHHRQGTDYISPRAELSHTANYLYMISGKIPSEEATQALDKYLMLTIDHGMNASTFTSRVVTSTQSDMLSAVVAGICSLKGPLHGGAPSLVDDMLDEAASASSASDYIRDKIESGDKLMGFGHRVYKTYDPRAAALRAVARKMPKSNANMKLSLDFEEAAIRLLEEHKPGRHLYPNVEFWAATVLRTVGIPRECYPATFAVSRTTGWLAHIFEQSSHNRLMRPSTEYIGHVPSPHQAADITS